MKFSVVKISTSMMVIAVLLFFSLDIASANLEEGLVVYFNFDQGETDLVKDMSGTGNDGIVHGETRWVDGPTKEFGKAVEFNGKDAYIEAPDNDSMDVGEGDITLMLWIKWHPDQLTDWPRPISKMPLFGTDKPGFDVLVPGVAGTVLQTFYGMSGASRQMVDVGHPLADEAWHHVVAMKEDEESKIYVDGVMAGSRQVTLVDIDNDYPFNVGASAQVAAHVYFRGSIDEAAFYTRALTEDEIEQAMASSIFMAVEAAGKLSTTWGGIKRVY